ncbi:hypothetical protein BDN67DRAFT_975156 [Paxillus ammoniavirescens]|nr:hypothetical protein BDN67DRAFT_975156 [Paxillus ammoniavirescens]
MAPLMYPKLVALDIDQTIFRKTSRKKRPFGKGKGAVSPIEDNIERVSRRVLRDKSNHKNKIRLYRDIPRIVTNILKHGAQLAIVSRNKNKALCDRALWYFEATDPKTGKKRPIIHMVKYDEVYNKRKTVHFTRIHRWSGFKYSDMILFDDEASNNMVKVKLGVTFQQCRGKAGLTWKIYQRGLKLWRRCKKIRSPYLGQDLKLYPKKKFIGYAGMDADTVDRLVKGKNRIDTKESARWGYAMYITDNPALAKYFSKWIKEKDGYKGKTYVCELWVRDRDLFGSIGKIWVPENGPLPKTNNKGWDAAKIAETQEARDRRVAKWGVKAPYILFSRHHWMDGMPIPKDTRWNEMVVYPQIQDAMFLTRPLTAKQVNKKIKTGHYGRFDKKIKAWNITVPKATVRDFKKHGEKIKRT